jgi:hypothetical protein
MNSKKRFRRGIRRSSKEALLLGPNFRENVKINLHYLMYHGED